MKQALTILVACLAVATQAATACSRSSIDYYLEKGFSHEQITAICKGGGENHSQGNTYRAYEDEVERHERREARDRQREQDNYFVENALAAQDVELTPRRLEYTRGFCLAAGKTPEVEGRTRVCPNVRYHIYFKGLEIGGYDRKYFFIGRREIQVRGEVRRKMLHDLSEYPSDIRRQLLAAYRHASRENATAIPMRRDVPVNRLIDILRKYVRLAEKQ